MPDSKDRRQFTRIAFDGIARLVDPRDNKQWETEVIDISLRGALIRRPAEGPADLSRPFMLQLALGNDIRMEFDVRVMHSDTHHLGLHMQQMDLDTAGHLHRLLELNLGDPALLERELAELLESD